MEINEEQRGSLSIEEYQILKNFGALSIDTNFEGVEKSYENYVTAFFSRHTPTFLGFCAYVKNKKLTDKFTDQLIIEEKILKQKTGE